MKHTQGPWDYRFEQLRGGDYHTVQRPGHDMEPIDLRADENGEADAKLISAAPDMHAALTAIIDAWNRGDTHDGHEALGMAEAALAKASGAAQA